MINDTIKDNTPQTAVYFQYHVVNILSRFANELSWEPASMEEYNPRTLNTLRVAAFVSAIHAITAIIVMSNFIKSIEEDRI